MDLWEQSEDNGAVAQLARAFEANAAVASSCHVVTGGIVHALTELLTAVTKRPRRTFCTQEQKVNTCLNLTRGNIYSKFVMRELMNTF